MHKRIKILDSLRGIAALLVLFHHLFKLNIAYFENSTTSFLFSILYWISSLNHDAVMFFFILSGFSIGLSLRNKTLNSKIDLNNYLYRRFKRILPIYWLAIIFSLLIGLSLQMTATVDYSWYNLVGNILFLQTSDSATDAWFVPYGLNGPLWSLSFEMFFYLFFPVAYYVNQNYLKNKSIFFKFALLLIISLIAIYFNKKIFFIPYLLFFTGFATWILGYLSSQHFLYKKNYTIFFVSILVLGSMILIFKDLIPSDTIAVIAKGMFINGLFYFFMLFFEKVNTNKLQKNINDVFFKIGEGSYAIYALHYPLLIFLSKFNIPIIHQVLVLICFIVLCNYIERITIRFKLKFLEIDYLFFIK